MGQWPQIFAPAAVLGWFLDTLKSPPFWVGAVLVGVTFWLAHLILRKRKFQISSVTLSLPFHLGNVSYQLGEEDRLLAWKLYVHLKTRKAALPFDNKDDVVIDVYDSLYELFQITRDLLCSVPVRNLQSEKNIAELMLRVQNDGLRPHLTKWQAPFRRWWINVIGAPENRDKSPQEIQRQFPDYEALVTDLRQMNTEMSKFAEELLRIVRPAKRSLLQRFLGKWGAREVMPQAPSSASVEPYSVAAEVEPRTAEQ